MAPLDFLKRLRIGRRPSAPNRDTAIYPQLQRIGQQHNTRTVFKPTPRNLRYFSHTPYARRAINAIKNPIAMMEWEVRPVKGIDLNPEIDRQIAVATACFANPNGDDTAETFVEQVVEDLLCGAAAFETQLGGDAIRPLWMWPVDGFSIQIFPAWSGDPSEARYTQSIGYGSYLGGGSAVQLRDDELVYIKPNPSTSTPFGVGPLEVAFTSISRQLGVGEYAGNLASNARPGIMLDLGETADEKSVSSFRGFWTNEVEGQGKVPIVSTKGGKVHKLSPDGDEALYLKWQEFLKVEIATAFDLSPQNLGVERDVNRSTGEVAEDRDWDQAIKPWARKLSSAFTKVIRTRLLFSQLEFRFVGLDREDEQATAEIYSTEYEANAIVPNEYRARRGLPPMESEWGEMTYADMQIAIKAAQGAASVLDDDLTTRQPAKPKPGAKES